VTLPPCDVASLPQAGEANYNPSISAVIVTFNECEVVERCLQSIVDWVQEIVVVDLGSTDGTRAIAARYTNRIIDHDLVPFVELVRDFALEQARGEWILLLDPDERVSDDLRSLLCELTATQEIDVVSVARINYVLGARLRGSGFHREEHIRFFRNGCIAWPAVVHGRPDVTGLHAVSLQHHADAYLEHDTWRTIDSTLDRVRRYAPPEVEMLHRQGQTFDVSTMARAMWQAFARSFIRSHGYRDGVRGLFVGLLLAQYRMVVHMELWEREGKLEQHDAAVVRWGRYANRIALVLEQIRPIIARTITVARHIPIRPREN
jgi:(heptosyl)LPS beta-1,4-glucosyltransferase